MLLLGEKENKLVKLFWIRMEKPWNFNTKVKDNHCLEN